MGEKRHFFKLSAGVAGIQYIFFALNLAGGIFLARALTPELFGEIALVLSILALLELVFTLSVNAAYIVTPQTPTLFSSAIILTLISWAILFCVMIIILLPLSYYYDNTIVEFLALLVSIRVFSYTAGVYLANFDKNLQVFKSSIISGSASSMSLLLAIYVATTDQKEISLLVRELSGGILVWISVLIFSKEKFKFSYQKKEITLLFHYSVKMFFSKAAETAYFKLPFFLIGSLFGTATLGLISQMFYLVSLPNTALSALTDKVAFTFYAKYNINKTSKNLMLYTNMFIILLTLPTAILTYIYGYEILFHLYGKKWIDGFVYLQYLSIMIILLPLFHNLRTYFYTISKNHIVTLTYIIALIIISLSIYTVHYLQTTLSLLALGFSLSYFIAFAILASSLIKKKA